MCVSLGKSLTYKTFSETNILNNFTILYHLLVMLELLALSLTQKYSKNARANNTIHNNKRSEITPEKS